MVVAVLPVEHTVFPITASLVPPFACVIPVFLSISVQHGWISTGSGIQVCRIWGKGVVDDFAKGNTAYDHYRVAAT